MNCTVHVHAGRLRDLGRHAGAGRGRRQYAAKAAGPAAREGDRQQPLPRRRLRPPARSRTWSRARCASPRKCRRPGQGGLDARRRHAARRLSAGLSRHASRPRCRTARSSAWKHRVTGSSVIARWLPPAFQNGIDIDAVDSAVDMPYDIPNKRVEYVRARATGGADRLLARRRTEQQCLRHRKLHGRAGAEGGQGPGRISACGMLDKYAAV